MTCLSCVLIGDDSLLIGCGEELKTRGHEIRAVLSVDPSVTGWARDNGISVLCQMQDIAAQPPFDWLLSIANLTLIPKQILDVPDKGSVNFHDGPLPDYAGLNVPAWALLNGENHHGITWHMIEPGVDTGDILVQRSIDIDPDETAVSLNSKCYAAAMDSFPDLLSQLESGTLAQHPQELTNRRLFARDDRPSAAARLDFRRPAKEICRTVRALDFGDYPNPLCLPKFSVGGNVIVLRKAVEDPSPLAGLPGTVLASTFDGLVVATGAGAIKLSEFSTCAGDPVDIVALVQVGDTLPSPTQDEADQIDAAITATAAHEPHWRNLLRDWSPVTLPLVQKGTEASHWERLRLSVPDGLNDVDVLRATLAVARASSGEDLADIAVTTQNLSETGQLAPGYLCSWVPLRAKDGAQIPDRDGFACDLGARDPQITQAVVPHIALAIDTNTPVPGSALTVCVQSGRAHLLVNRTMLSDDDAERLAGRFECAISAALHAPDCPVQNLDVMPETERRLQIETFNQTTRPYNATTIHHAVEAQVARSPDAPALVFQDRMLSYAQMNARANAVAQNLRDENVGPGSHVGLFLPHGPELVIAALAVLKAGGAYVPLDPAYPVDRLAHYLRDSGASVVLCDQDLQQNLPETTAQVVPITDQEIAENVDGGATSDDLAYLIYTSGSTGTPKGVMIEHRNVSNFFVGMDERVPHQPGDTWLAVTSLNFDISVLELFWTLSRGFKVVLSGDDNRAVVSGGPVQVSGRPIAFNLMYWGNDDGAGPKKYELLLEGAKFADANGFNAVWTPERHFHAFGGPYPNPSVTGAAVAAVTNNLSVRAGSCVAPLHHPARIAEEWAIIDNLTNGRAGLGIASGWQPDDFVLRPENTPPANKPAMYDSIKTLRKLWRGEAVAFPKADGSMHDVITQPRPVSRDLPIWVTTAGNPDTWREAGEIGANVLTHLLGQSIDEVAGKIRIYHVALRENGYDPADFKVTLMLHTYLAETRQESARIAREPMKDYLRSAAGLIKQYAWAFPAFKKPKGVANSFELDLGVLSDDELESILDFAFERYFEESGLFGTVEDGVERAEQLKRIGVDEIACLIDYGIAPEKVLEGLKPLAEVLSRSNAPTDLADDDFSLAAQILRHKVTHLQCTPSMARMIAANDEARMALGHLSHLLIGGEALPSDLVADLLECTGAQIQNMYGPTETTIWSTTSNVTPGTKGIEPVGTPIANTEVFVVDSTGALCPIGAPGELLIGGGGVARGYWQRPDLTQERFIASPFGEGQLYRTGDLARWRGDGQLEFLGRSDHQVKIRGQRIELGEIETLLTQHDGVTAAVALARGDSLIGYVTGTATEADLRTKMAQHLPEALVPSRIVVLERFPLTPNKKIDRNALPEPTREVARTDTVQLSDDCVQAKIAAIWGRILGISGIGPQDNFFALGGHSLLAVQAHRDIRTELGHETLSITDIFRFPVLADLAAHLGDADQSNEPAAPSIDRNATMNKRRAMRDRRKARA